MKPEIRLALGGESPARQAQGRYAAERTMFYSRRSQTALVRSLVKLVVVVSLAVSCATTGKYQRVLQSWMGADVNRLMQSWGPPSSQYTMPNRDIMYTWLWVGGTLVTASYSEYLNMVTAGAVTYWCKTTFTASPTGILHSWRWEGNACRST